MADTVTMLDSDTHIAIRLFLDTAVAEAYFMGGRVAMTIPVTASTTDWSVSIGASAATQLSNATSWGMSSIYVTQEEVLHAGPSGTAFQLYRSARVVFKNPSQTRIGVE